jgi:hypothetical protein
MDEDGEKKRRKRKTDEKKRPAQGLFVSWWCEQKKFRGSPFSRLCLDGPIKRRQTKAEEEKRA